jgi:hypothetical protein
MDRDKYQKQLFDPSDKKTSRTDRRDTKKDKRKDYKLDKIRLLTEKFHAVAAKRKWLVFLLALGIAAYFIVSSNAGGILTKIKTFF